jgi:hypothetical protein
VYQTSVTTRQSQATLQLHALEERLSSAKKHASQVALQNELVTNLSKSREQCAKWSYWHHFFLLVYTLHYFMRRSTAGRHGGVGARDSRIRQHSRCKTAATIIFFSVIVDYYYWSSSSSSSNLRLEGIQGMDHVDNSTIAVFIVRFIDATNQAKVSSGNKRRFMSSLMDQEMVAAGHDLQQQAEKEIDRIGPNVPLCPYELGGERSDPYCSYQHLLPRGPGG